MSENVDPDITNAIEAEQAGLRFANVYDAATAERSTVIDARSDTSAVAEIGDAYHGAKRKRAVGNAAVAVIPGRNACLRVNRRRDGAERKCDQDRLFHCGQRPMRLGKQLRIAEIVPPRA